MPAVTPNLSLPYPVGADLIDNQSYFQQLAVAVDDRVNKVINGTTQVGSAASAGYASSAGYAGSAGSAGSANTANYATSAGSANSANTAGTANYANSAGSAGTANSANTANHADDASIAAVANLCHNIQSVDTPNGIRMHWSGAALYYSIDGNPWTQFAIVCDRTLKQDIVPVSDADASGMVQALKVYSYTFKDPATYGEGTQYGFMADEVDDIVPGAVTQPSSTSSGDYVPAGLDLGPIVALLVGTIQSLTERIAALELRP